MSSKIPVLKIAIAIAITSLLASFGCDYTLNTPIYPTFKNIFLITLTALPFFGAITGIMRAKEWSYQSVLGKTLVYTSVGTLLWGMGMLAWDYWVINGNDIPYPSIADVFFVSVYIFWLLGLYYMYNLLQVNNMIKKDINPVFLTIVIVPIMYIVQMLFTVVAKGAGIVYDPYSVAYFLDIFYTVLSTVMLAVVVMLYLVTFKTLGGIYKRTVIALIMGYALQAIGDFTFAYLTRKDLYYNGSLPDKAYIISLFCVILGVYFLSNKEVLKAISTSLDKEIAKRNN